MPMESGVHQYVGYYLVCDDCGLGSEDLVELSDYDDTLAKERLASAAATLGGSRWCYDPVTNVARCPRCVQQDQREREAGSGPHG